MLTRLFFLLGLASLATAQQEAPMDSIQLLHGNERRLSTDGRDMMHMHLQSTPLYGNSTDFMYFYVTMYFGSQRQP
jgi:hypothetical protein